MSGGPTYTLILAARAGTAPEHALRAVQAVAKFSLRAWGLRCIAISAAAAPGRQRRVGGRTNRADAPGTL
jgi:hypothetical protein